VLRHNGSNGDGDDFKVNLTKCEDDVLHSWELWCEEEDLVSHSNGKEKVFNAKFEVEF